MRLVIADDHSLFREALCHYLTTGFGDIEIVEAQTLEEGLQQAAESKKPVDALLLDFVMPGMDGIRGVVRAKSRFPGVPIVVLSGNISREDAQAAVRSGAAGVISKDLNGTELIGVLKRILAGEKYVASSAWMAPVPAVGEQAWVRFGLTPRELDVLGLLVRGMADKAIAHELGIAGITVRLHLRNLFRKLGARSRVDVVRIALGPSRTDAPH